MSSVRIKTAALVYGLLTAVAVAWGVCRGNTDLFHHPQGLTKDILSFPVALLVAIAVGVAFGLLVSHLTKVLVFRFRWARQLHIEFRGLLGPLKGGEIFIYAVLTAVGEELLFRGAMQPVVGIVPTSLVFGLAHIAWGRKSIPWPMQAIVMGFAFGGLFYATGNLAAPVLAHFTINYQNLHFINAYDPSLQLPRTFSQR